MKPSEQETNAAAVAKHFRDPAPPMWENGLGGESRTARAPATVSPDPPSSAVDRVNAKLRELYPGAFPEADLVATERKTWIEYVRLLARVLHFPGLWGRTYDYRQVPGSSALRARLGLSDTHEDLRAVSARAVQGSADPDGWNQ